MCCRMNFLSFGVQNAVLRKPYYNATKLKIRKNNFLEDFRTKGLYCLEGGIVLLC